MLKGFPSKKVFNRIMHKVKISCKYILPSVIIITEEKMWIAGSYIAGRQDI
jgi:hypothetical protein